MTKQESFPIVEDIHQVMQFGSLTLPPVLEKGKSMFERALLQIKFQQFLDQMVVYIVEFGWEQLLAFGLFQLLAIDLNLFFPYLEKESNSEAFVLQLRFDSDLDVDNFLESNHQLATHLSTPLRGIEKHDNMLFSFCIGRHTLAICFETGEESDLLVQATIERGSVAVAQGD